MCEHCGVDDCLYCESEVISNSVLKKEESQKSQFPLMDKTTMNNKNVTEVNCEGCANFLAWAFIVGMVCGWFAYFIYMIVK